jgi:hypothetical protein
MTARACQNFNDTVAGNDQELLGKCAQRNQHFWGNRLAFESIRHPVRCVYVKGNNDWDIWPFQPANPPWLRDQD